MYLSYSGFKLYQQCPRQYWHRYIGKTQPPKPDNRVNMLFGSAVGTVFEAFYNDKLWNKPNPYDACMALVEPTVARIMKEEGRKGLFNWGDPKANYHSLDDMLDAVREAIPNGLSIIKQHRLLGPMAQAEVKLDSKYDGHLLGGRADFIIKRTAPHHDLIILDGKGSRHREKYVDGMQLRWYAMLYQMTFNALPDKLGFVFWRWPPGKALDWEPFTPEGLTDLAKTAVKGISTIETGVNLLKGANPVGTGVFSAIPERMQCQLCSFAIFCPESGIAAPMTSVSGVLGVQDVGFDS